MTSRQLVSEFEKTWFYTRGISNDFLKAMPDHLWHYTHHPKYAPFSKQFRHMTCVYGVYIDGFKNQAVDFNQKHSFYSGPLDRLSLFQDLQKKDEELKFVLKNMSDENVENFKLDFFGVNMSFSEYSHVLIQHECMHIGTWGTMAAMAGFEVPPSWKSDWGFK